ncbi:hypothetical protein M5D96_009415 [Drosophila gunungcola]|uniref:Uncharacterized protein n=1 Tax=Drosophila gunungcola TaxID=103775 RepID=A0A9P9YJ38_9MUSC|nr:hypothetical protein M5D96_009415 [Drosophila gunungcola]
MLIAVCISIPPAGGANGNKRNNKNKPRSARKDVIVVNGGDADCAAAEVAEPAAPAAVSVAGEEPRQQATPRQKHQQDNAADQHQNPQGEGQANGQNISEKDRKYAAQGETLELNQLNKIKMEARYLDELKALKLSA